MMLFSLRWLLIVLLACTCTFRSILGQDLALYGKFEQIATEITLKEISEIKSKCFQGYGFSGCRPVYQKEEFTKAQNLAYYNKLNDLYGANYCLQCCGKQPDHLDTWDLYCDLNRLTADSVTKQYRHELRLAANQFDGDASIITCPLQRKICSYDSAGKILPQVDGLGQLQYNCPPKNYAASINSTDYGATIYDPNRLVGYTLHLEINMRDQYFKYWRGVRSCRIETEEVPINETAVYPTNTDRFRETIVIHHFSDFADLFDMSKLGIVMLVVYSVVYGVLYYFRRRLCLYCGNKLVFSHEMCHKCKFVGAHPPDPVLLLALAEKGMQIQGDHIEVFPGSERAVKWYERQKASLGKLWRRWRKIHPPDGEGEMDGGFELMDGAGGKGANHKHKHGNGGYGHANDDASVGGASMGTLDTEDETKDGAGAGAGQGAGTGTAAAAEAAEAGDGAESVVSAATAATTASQAPYLNFFPFHWKYPGWAKKYLGLRNKKKPPPPPYVNPNLLNVSRHIIFGAVDHHAPPPADEAYMEYRKQFILDRLGYLPGDYEDQADPNFQPPVAKPKGAIATAAAARLYFEDEKTGQKLPFWQAKGPGIRMPPPVPEEPGCWSAFTDFCPFFKQSDISKVRNSFIKNKNQRDLPPTALMVKTGLTILCIFGTLFAMLVFGLNLQSDILGLSF